MHSTAHRIRPARVAIGALALVVLAAGALYFSGTYDRWLTPDPASACAGTLDRPALREVLTGDAAKEIEYTAPVRPGSLTQCVVMGDGPAAARSVWVDVRWGSKADAQSLGGTVGGERIHPVNGWPAVVAGSTATVNLPCLDRKDESLLVDVSLMGVKTLDKWKVRTELASFSVKSAERAAKQFGCAISPGPEVKDVEKEPRNSDAVPLAGAQGTCAPLRPLKSAAAQAGATLALEEPAEKNAPLTECTLLTSKHQLGYELAATFGPYAKAFRNTSTANPQFQQYFGAQNDYASATARCPGSPERALFTLRHRGKPDPAFEAAALKAFATDAAKQHGCTDLRLP
ncbi:hypothetical protein ACH4SP_01200 [Streptomyces sp. NPDC021093]|uniref:hypothetical protein n=1 Tax=Streptomyces sp. NPDC021093 TaxID=3365112 RepID=UPI00378D1994